MHPSKAREILEALLDGFDPITGEVLSEASVVMHRDVMRAISKAVNALAGVEDPEAAHSYRSARNGLVAEPISDRRTLTLAEDQTYELLRRWRNERAQLEGLAAYMIAHNRHLHEMVTLPARSFDDLCRIKGFGAKRAEKYADELLPILAPPA